MIKILKFAALMLIFGAAIVVGMAIRKPDYFRIQRTITIEAPAVKIFPHINTMRAWAAWSPWEKLDPDMERIFSGPESGAGSRYAWKGDKNIGEGSTEIMESIPPSKIVMSLDFIKPFAAHNTVEFTLVSAGNDTDVTWAMHGPQPFIGKVMSIFMSCDKMVGQQFDAGLASLKNTVEAEP